MKDWYIKYERVISIASIFIILCGWIVDKTVFQKMNKIEVESIKSNQIEMMKDMRSVLELKSQASLLIELLKPKVTEDEG